MCLVDICNSTCVRNLWLIFKKNGIKDHIWRQGRMYRSVEKRIIKGYRIKHILPKFFFTHDLQKNGDINVQQVCLCENLAYLFTKSLPRKTFEQLIHKIQLSHLKDNCLHEWRNKYVMHSFSFPHGFGPLGFPEKVLNEVGDNVLKNDVLFFLH